ncbi:FeoB-associated Cys-rich membrane protein [Pedobacter antarcticus]|uniref:FeoB-associated Cys-rich membrane protein n=1 Tax=Pedobacter antarcticus TaxID=34086 RepID=UPI001C59940A|nr:FeoB-associated Cys-rich membrane protein [Pedobacter antarcticus]
MDLQTILVGLLFAAALFYIGRIIYRAVSPKSSGCGSNCKCGVDFSNIETPKK